MASGAEAKAEVNNDSEGFVDELKAGTELLGGQYTISKFLNSGGFGITYLAKDSLDRTVVIKECFPGSFCRRSRTIVAARSRAHKNEFQSIVKLFVNEAKSLSKLVHPNIVGVHQVFEDNDTAYMAIDFVDGRDLLDVIDDKKLKIDPEMVQVWLAKMLDAIAFVHESDILHRDISPDNILIDSKGEPILIDFGAAREEATKASRALSALRVVKDGYSPQEFYVAGSTQNESSDLYALGATFYHVLTGEAPPNSQARLASMAESNEDPYVPLENRIKGYPKDFLKSIDKALKVLPRDRIQDASEWLSIIQGAESPVVRPAKANTAPNGGGKKMSPVIPLVAVAAVVGIGFFAYTQFAPSEQPVETATPSAGQVVVSDNNASSTANTQSVDLLNSAAWSVEMPFLSDPIVTEEGTFPQVTLVRSNADPSNLSWLQSGVIVYAVNGELTFDQDRIKEILMGISDASAEGTISVDVRIKRGAGDEYQDETLTVPVVREIEFANGIKFVSRANGSAWVTTVVDVPANSADMFDVGDILLTESTTKTDINTSEALEDALRGLQNDNLYPGYFTVKRGEELMVVEVEENI